MTRLRSGSTPLPRGPTFGTARAGRRRSAWRRRAAWIAAGSLALILTLAAGPVHHVYFDRSGLPDLGSFLRFEPPAVGAVFDDRGEVLVEVAREYRRVVTYDEVPVILREAILAAEDNNFFSHSGVEYRALPRVIQKSAMHSLAAWWRGEGLRPLFPQGGSTLTQQLVRSYFLRDLTLRENGDVLVDDGLIPRVLSAGLGVRATNKLMRKMEEVRLSLWLEEEMRRRCGSPDQAKREIFARYASFIYLGNGRYGFASASEYYFGKSLSSYTPADAGEVALLAGISKSPKDYAPAPGDPRPLRRRNAILSLMARDGYIPEDLAKRCAAEPVRLAARSASKTAAPAAIENVLAEIRQHGGSRFGIEDLFQGRISVRSTVDGRVQTVVNEALENGLTLYEERHRRSRGVIQGSAVVLRNADAAILAEAGGRQVFKDHVTRYSDFNRVTDSLRQPGSAWKPIVYLTAFRQGLGLDTTVPDEPIEVPLGADNAVKWIANYDKQFKGPIPVREALAESRNAVAVWIAREVGIDKVNRTARDLGIRSPLNPYISTALGASEVRLLELADAYRAIASEVAAEPHVITRVTDAASGAVLYEASPPAPGRGLALSGSIGLSLIQEGLRGVVRLPEGTAHALDGPDFPIPVMGKTGTTSSFRDALFVGSTYGPLGITVAVRIGFDDNRTLGDKETGARAALPIFREIMLRLYQDQLVGPVPRFPCDLEGRIDAYLEAQGMPQTARAEWPPADDEHVSPPPALTAPARLTASRDLPIAPPWVDPFPRRFTRSVSRRDR
jgi:penicillin-binding protein 1A